MAPIFIAPPMAVSFDLDFREYRAAIFCMKNDLPILPESREVWPMSFDMPYSHGGRLYGRCVAQFERTLPLTDLLRPPSE